MKITKQTDGLWRFGTRVFDSKEDAKAFEFHWLKNKAEREISDFEKSDKATQKSVTKTGMNFGGVALIMAAFSVFAFGLYSCKNRNEQEFSDMDALVLCQLTFEKISRDPYKAEIPAVQNFGKGDEAYFAWGPSTKVMRMRNGLGLDVAATGSCVVNKSAKKITSLTLNGESII